jgi:hypothetical protein
MIFVRVSTFRHWEKPKLKPQKRASSFFWVFSKETMEYPSRILPLEPESEVHSVESQGQRDNESSEKSFPIIAPLTEENLNLIETATVDLNTKESTNSQQRVEKDNSKDDYDAIFGFDFGSFSGDDHSDFRNSVALLREEASRIDAVLAIDKIETLESELRVMIQDLNNRCEELAEAREIIDLKDSRIWRSS